MEYVGTMTCSSLPFVLATTSSDTLTVFYQATIITPLGEMTAICSSTHLLALLFKDMKNFQQQIRKLGKSFRFHPSQLEEVKTDLTMTLQRQIDNFFNNVATTTFTIPICLMGSSFQQKTYKKLIESASFGERISYSILAKKIDGTGASRRAVALALASNPILLLIPCHRVIPSDATKGIGGFAAGVKRKMALLHLEASFMQKDS